MKTLFSIVAVTTLGATIGLAQTSGQATVITNSSTAAPDGNRCAF
ncbi:MAG TPA: hypothetical protein VOA64_05850 [Candidatus Dormibacteraeota bacterium]|nr:hypothetical protein [Candidatus Dormibacteraeota bacterium]